MSFHPHRPTVLAVAKNYLLGVCVFALDPSSLEDPPPPTRLVRAHSKPITSLEWLPDVQGTPSLYYEDAMDLEDPQSNLGLLTAGQDGRAQLWHVAVDSTSPTTSSYTSLKAAHLFGADLPANSGIAGLALSPNRLFLGMLVKFDSSSTHLMSSSYHSHP